MKLGRDANGKGAIDMAEPKARKRKSAETPKRKPVKVSTTLDAEMHDKLVTFAVLRSQSIKDVLAELIGEAVGGVIFYDSRKTPRPAQPGESLGAEPIARPDAERKAG